ncbi:MAG: hypothetical protein QW622_02390 [Candidatus Pacearchaeota archaeon]
MAKLKWFDVSLDVIKKKIPIIGVDLANIENKTILYDMTRELKGKMAEAKFKVKIKDKNPCGEIVYFGLVQNYVRRLVRKGTSPVEDSFFAVSKDGVRLQVKPLFVTRKKVVRNIRKKIRERGRELIIKLIENNNKDIIFDSIINYVWQKQILTELKKIYPLLICEIRRIEVKQK